MNDLQPAHLRARLHIEMPVERWPAPFGQPHHRRAAAASRPSTNSNPARPRRLRRRAPTTPGRACSVDGGSVEHQRPKSMRHRRPRLSQIQGRNLCPERSKLETHVESSPNSRVEDQPRRPNRRFPIRRGGLPRRRPVPSKVRVQLPQVVRAQLLFSRVSADIEEVWRVLAFDNPSPTSPAQGHIGVQRRKHKTGAEASIVTPGIARPTHSRSPTCIRLGPPHDEALEQATHPAAVLQELPRPVRSLCFVRLRSLGQQTGHVAAHAVAPGRNAAGESLQHSP